MTRRLFEGTLSLQLLCHCMPLSYQRWPHLAYPRRMLSDDLGAPEAADQDFPGVQGLGGLGFRGV